MFSRRHPFLFFYLVFASIVAVTVLGSSLLIYLGARHTDYGASLTDGEDKIGVIEVTGVTSAMHQALCCGAPLARVVALGCSREKADGVDFYRDVYRTGVSIIGAHNFVRPTHESSPGYWTMQDDVRVLLRLLAARRLQVRPMISERVSPEEAPTVYRRLLNDPCPPLGVVFAWNDGKLTVEKILK